MTTIEYLHKAYAGFLGMNVGIRLGAPVEPTLWTSERIRRFYGEIRSYIKKFTNFAADDDANGPVYFLRALDDGAMDRDLRAEDIAEAWLNYTREGIGMFWWGGYGVSTEHTAYLNLLNGIRPPDSGSKAVNGTVLAEQIGGQIFIDTWGLVYGGNCDAAARAAVTAASVSHDGEGLHGAAFIAACIAAAFNTDNIDTILDEGYARIPADSVYARMVRAVREFHRSDTGDWRNCLAYLQAEWGYDKYPGICHIIPNAAVCVMALLYGRTFARGVEIATMAGWDTDCNAGNVGTILGVAGGIDSIPCHYREPINDSIVLSGISGYLNILDIPTYAKRLTAMHVRLSGKELPADLDPADGAIDFDFSLPGSTHNFRVSNSLLCRLDHEDGRARILFDRMVRGQECRIYYKPFYRRSDFDDERYMPVFSPTIYPGQKVRIEVETERMAGESIIISPYVRNTATKEIIFLGGSVVVENGRRDIEFTVPDCGGAMVDEVGIQLEGNSPEKNRDFGCLYLRRFTVSGKASYRIGMDKQSKEFSSITPFSHNHGAWELSKHAGRAAMDVMCLHGAQAFTGNYFMRDLVAAGSVAPHTGSSHLIGARIQGARRGYYAGFSEGKAAIFRHEGDGFTELASTAFPWTHERWYDLQFCVIGKKLTLTVDGTPAAEVQDDRYAHGMAGYAMFGGGRCSFGDLSIHEL